MSPARLVWLLAALLVTTSGCAQSGSLLSSRTTVGSLKASLSHLEYENQQLKREVASLKDENREMENRIVQEEAANGDLTARLDDARSLLSQRGVDASPNGLAPGRRPPPAARSTKKPRKAPFAQTPGRIDALPPAEDAPPPEDGRGTTPRPSGNDPGPTSRLDRTPLWLPV